MLVITRFRDQRFTLTVGDKVAVISVLDVRQSGAVRIGIEAPDEVNVLRDDAKQVTQ